MSLFGLSNLLSRVNRKKGHKISRLQSLRASLRLLPCQVFMGRELRRLTPSKLISIAFLNNGFDLLAFSDRSIVIAGSVTFNMFCCFFVVLGKGNFVVLACKRCRLVARVNHNKLRRLSRGTLILILRLFPNRTILAAKTS